MRRISRFPQLPDPAEGLRAAVDRAAQAEALAASWIEHARPLLLRISALRRRIATIAVLTLAAFLFGHVLFGANGMVVYKQKRTEYQELHQQIIQVEQENERYTQQIQALKTDQTAIEKEAREQLGYARAGEVVYVPPTSAKPVVPANRSAKK